MAQKVRILDESRDTGQFLGPQGLRPEDRRIARLQSRLAPRSDWLGESAMPDQFLDERTEEVLIVLGSALIAASLAMVYALFV
jgi:hypothetical protein